MKTEKKINLTYVIHTYINILVQAVEKDQNKNVSSVK